MTSNHSPRLGATDLPFEVQGRLFETDAATPCRVMDSELWFSPFEEVSPPAWSKGRVVLIGDAAHATAPNMAEGASLAIEDALVLCECLTSGGDVPSALATFIERRTARVAHVQHMTRRRDRLRYLHPALRRAVLSMAGPATFRAHYRPLLSPP